MECCDFDFRLKAPFCMTISGATQSGKSTLVKAILERRYDLIDVPIDDILYCYTEYQKEFFESLTQNIPTIKFHVGLPEEFADPVDRHRLVVLDDLMQEVCKSNISSAFTRTSHHRNVSIIFLTQNFFEKAQRTITTNCQYICFTKNPREVSQVCCFGRQLTKNGKRNESLEECYEKVMQKPYGHIFIDLHQCQNPIYRIRDSIFPEGCTVYKSS